MYRTEKVLFPKPFIMKDGRVFDGFHEYLRFFADGTVLSSSRPEAREQPTDLSEIASWLSKENPAIPRSSYTVHDGVVTFTKVSNAGTVRWSGGSDGDGLSMDWHSEINGKYGVYKFSFITFTR